VVAPRQRVAGLGHALLVASEQHGIERTGAVRFSGRPPSIGVGLAGEGRLKSGRRGAASTAARRRRHRQAARRARR
jgi:hypothetical protein